MTKIFKPLVLSLALIFVSSFPIKGQEHPDPFEVVENGVILHQSLQIPSLDILVAYQGKIWHCTFFDWGSDYPDEAKCENWLENLEK